MKTPQKLILFVVVPLLLGIVLFALPPVHQRVYFYLDQLRIRVFYLFNPPEEEVFTPREQDRLEAIVQATLSALAVTPPAASPTASAAPIGPTGSPTAAPTTAPPTATPTPLPAQALIDAVPYVDQHYGQNNCAPANLAMALQFWGWQGNVGELTLAVKPFDRDKNVMPYELADYVNAETDLRAIERFGGTAAVLKKLVAAGFPVIVERGVYLRDLGGKVSWMGHYQVVYGYDDAQGRFNVKDSFEKQGETFTVTYDELQTGWRSFNYAFVVVYAPEREPDLMAALGPYADAAQADRLAYEIASEEIYTTEGQDTFFAWYNRGSSLVRLQDYVTAAQAYDDAFAVYADLPAASRPYRITWYMTGPYFAYYYVGRYADVVALADKTIGGASDPFLEENFYWRARAKDALGDTQGAIADYRQSLEYHPGFDPSLAELQALGATP
jgi:hypothetical protein